MDEQPHARFYRGLPPVVRHQPRGWLLIGVLSAIALSAIALPVYEWNSIGGRAAGEKVAAAFFVGGVLGYAVGRRWWSIAALLVGGFAILLAVLPSSGFGYSGGAELDTAAWFNWMYGVCLGAGIYGLERRHRLSQPR